MEDINLIRKIAWRFAKKTNIEYDELFQEAAYRYCLALQDWDEDKKKNCSFSSFAYRRMYFRLINFCKEESKISSTTAHIEDLANRFEDSEESAKDSILHQLGLVENPTDPIEETIAEWPEDCQYIARKILNAPSKFLGETPERKRTDRTPKKNLKNKLRNEGWTHQRINFLIKDMKACIQSL